MSDLRRVVATFRDRRSYDLGTVDEWQRYYPGSTAEDVRQNFMQGWSGSPGQPISVELLESQLGVTSTVTKGR